MSIASSDSAAEGLAVNNGKVEAQALKMDFSNTSGSATTSSSKVE